LSGSLDGADLRGGKYGMPPPKLMKMPTRKKVGAAPIVRRSNFQKSPGQAR